MRSSVARAGLVVAGASIALALGGLSAPAAGAASAGSGVGTLVPNKTIKACYNKKTGAMRFTKNKCKRGEKKISWNSTGPIGPQGPVGPPGATGAQGPIGPANLTTAFVRGTATDGADEATARAAASEIPLFTRGQLSFYAKCFRDVALNQVRGEIYIRTAADGAIFDGTTDELNGGPLVTDYLNIATPEADRQLDTEIALLNDTGLGEGEYTAMAPDGTSLLGQTSIGVKNGSPGGGNGAYGEGNVCLFGISAQYSTPTT